MELLSLSNDEHGTPDEDMECMATMEDITDDDKNYCEYQTAPSGKWHKSKYSASTVRRLITHQFPEYVSGVRKADCAADLKRRLAKGPPIYVEDKHALPIPEDDTHICRIWFAEDGKEYSSKLKGCVEVRRPPVAVSRCAHHPMKSAEAAALVLVRNPHQWFPRFCCLMLGRAKSATSCGRSSRISRPWRAGQSQTTKLRRRPNLKSNLSGVGMHVAGARTGRSSGVAKHCADNSSASGPPRYSSRLPRHSRIK